MTSAAISSGICNLKHPRFPIRFFGISGSEASKAPAPILSLRPTATRRKGRDFMRDKSGDGQDGTQHVNSKGVEYPDIIDLKTGERLKFPEGDLDIVPEENRAQWYASQSMADAYRTNPDEILCKKDFIDEWYAQGYTTPEGGWSLYDIHHIKPRSRGGDNSFDNLTPVLRTLHRKLLNIWWRFLINR